MITVPLLEKFSSKKLISIIEAFDWLAALAARINWKKKKKKKKIYIGHRRPKNGMFTISKPKSSRSW